MTNKYTKIAFKQTVKKEWLDKTLELVCAGYSEDEIRKTLYEYLTTYATVGEKKRSLNTCSMAVSMLSCWFRPDNELLEFRNALIEEAKKTNSSAWLPFHMAIMSASYPFWFNVCVVTGKLFSYQDVISTTQIYDKMKSIYGDKSTVYTDTKYAISTMWSWGIITPVEKPINCFQLSPKVEISNPKIQTLLFESVLLAKPEGKALYEDVYRNSGLFAFQYDYIPASIVEALSKGRVHMINYGLTNEYLCLDNKENC